MHFMKKYIKKYWAQFCLALVFLTAEAVCDLLQPTIMSKIVDVGVAGKLISYVLHWGGVMLMITAVGALSASGRNIVSSIVSQKFGAELRSDLYRKIQTLSFHNLDKFDRASLITRLTNDVTQMQNFVNGLMRIFVKAPLLCIGSLIMAVRLDPHLSIILVAVVPFVSLLIFLNMRVSFPLFLRVQKALDRVNGMMREYLSGVRVVKAFNRFDYEVEKFSESNETYQTRSISAMRAMSIFTPSISLVVNLGIVAVIWLGGLRVNNGQLHVGHIIAFINYMTQILFSLMTISMVFMMFARAKASTGRIGEIFAEENPLTWGITSSSGLIRGQVEFDNVSFTYEGASGPPVLKNITFSCMPGETVGIIGSTGSGKSSLVSLIPRFYDAMSGSVKVNGEDVHNLKPAKLREKVAIVPQKTMLFTGTVQENVRWGNEQASDEELVQACAIAQAHDFISSFKEGYDTRIGQGGVNFSGGQKQRVSIARALIRKPEILILDDCTSAVDVATETAIKDGLQAYGQGLTCLIIAQRITSVMDADKIVVMDEGQVVGIGKHSELMESCPVYREIYQSQIGKEMESDVPAGK